jgi:two-component system response regulator
MQARRRSVLVIEDRDDEAELARAAFARSGTALDLTVIDDGGDAVDYLLRRAAFAGRAGESGPDLVLLDLKLPGIDGFEVLRRVRADASLATIAIVVFTSSVEESDIVRGALLGANSYVRKPTDFDAFVDVARRLAAYWLGLHVVPAPESKP